MVHAWTVGAESVIGEKLSSPIHDWQGRMQKIGPWIFRHNIRIFQLLSRSCNLRTLELVALDLGSKVQLTNHTSTVQYVIMHKVWTVPLWDSEKFNHNA